MRSGYFTKLPSRIFAGLSLLLLLTAIFGVSVLTAQDKIPGQQKNNENRALKDEVIPVHSLDITYPDFSDLNRLVPLLKNVRVIGLGENRHDDGATFKAKARLVRFLHEKLGFEVLAFESSFYGGLLANQQLDRDSTDFGKINRDLPGWFQSRYGYTVLDYAKQTRARNNPLILAGFDDEKQPDAVANLTGLIARIYEIVHWIPVAAPMKKQIDSLVRGIGGALGNPWYAAIKDSKSRVEAATQLKALLDALETDPARVLAAVSTTEYRNLKLGLLSFLMTNESMAYGNTGGLGWNMMRDYFMSKRIQWLTDSVYPGKKIILWAATGHLAKNIISIDRQESSAQNIFSLYPYYQTGDYLRQLYGDAYYSVAFTSYGGQYGLLYPDAPRLSEYEYRQDVPASAKGSVEDLFHQLTMPYLFADLRNTKSGLLNAPRIGHPLGYTLDFANWPGIIDAFFYIDHMEPDISRINK